MVNSQSLVMAVRYCDDSVQILLCHDMFVTVCYHFLIGYCFVSRDNPQIERSSSGFPPHRRISDRKYSMLNIYDSRSGAPPTFFRADSVTLNTPHTTGKSYKIIFRTTKIIGHHLRLSEGEKSAQNQPNYIVVCVLSHCGYLCWKANLVQGRQTVRPS